jgi:geranylgeranyl reductase family protein
MAFQLAQAERRVVVREKGPLDREKSCGGGIQTQEIVEFGRPPEEAIERWITTARMYSSQNEALEVPQLADLCGATVKRCVFDSYLQERATKAGASFLPHHRAVDIESSNGTATLSVMTPEGAQKMEAKLVVYAAGSTPSPVKRRVGVPHFDPDRMYVAIQCWIELEEEQVDERVGSTIELYGGSKVVPEGYGWIFPKRTILSVGLGTSLTAITSRGLDLRELLEEFLHQHPVVREKLDGGKRLYTDGGLIPARCLDQLVYPRMILLGDSAGVGNAIHGGGIYQARKSAEIATSYIGDFIDTGQQEALWDYEDRVKERFWNYESRWDNKIVRFFHKDILFDSAIALANSKPKRKLSEAFSIILNSTESHEQAYYLFEKAMLDIVYRLFEEKAEPYRQLLEDHLAARDAHGPLLTPSIDHILFADAKRFRATLAFLAFELFAEDLNRALPVAAAYELLHTASLIHDDIMDGAAKRRGLETVHVRFGEGAAITSGDLLIFEAYQELLQADWDPAMKERICALFSASGVTVSEGQGMDLYLSRRFDKWSMEAYLKMIEMKTGGLIESPLVAGGMLAGANEHQLGLLKRLGTNLGMAFQIIDDSNDLLGSEDVSLKALYGDLRNGKCTTILTRCYEMADESQRTLIRAAAESETLEEEAAATILDLCRELDAVAHSQRLCGDLAESSREALSELPDNPARGHLTDINDIIDDWCSLGRDVKPMRRSRAHPKRAESARTIPRSAAS